MSCQHRFYDILIPQQVGLKFIFIGTFNPVWDAVNANNANYFYGRATSLFWCILPHAFNKNCLIDKERTEWEEFCVSEKIALTDLISCVRNADYNNKEHIDLLTLGFKDENLDKKVDGQFVFNLDFTTQQLKQLIDANKQTLKGVFFTRTTNQGISRIWTQWQHISEYCQQLDIYYNGLPTPSVRGGTIRSKISTWRQEIQNCI